MDKSFKDESTKSRIKSRIAKDNQPSAPSAGTKNPTKRLRTVKSEKVRTAKDVPNAAKKALKIQAENTRNAGNSGCDAGN